MKGRSKRVSDYSNTLPKDKRIPFQLQLYRERVLPQISKIRIPQGLSEIPEHILILFDTCETSKYSKQLYEFFDEFKINQSLSEILN